MLKREPVRVGYVVKRYPRYSETFIVNEILAHEAAGMPVEIFSLRPPIDRYFQDVIARVRAPVNYLSAQNSKVPAFWSAVGQAAGELPGFWPSLEDALCEKAYDVHNAIVLARQARLSGIEHLHAHFATDACTVTRLAARFAGLPYSFTAHAKDIFHEDVDANRLRDKLRDAAAAVTVSDFNVGYLRQQFGPAAARLHRVYNGLDLDVFRFDAPRVRPAQVVAVGRLVEKKGFGHLIDACALLARNNCRFNCKIIGTGDREADLRRQIERLGIGRWVELVGPRPQADVIRAIGDSAVLAAPCVVGEDGNRDGLPTVLLEAMALGTPCVATAVTGIPEAIQDQVTGMIVPQEDPATLAAALRRLLEDANLRTRLAAAARRVVEQQFDVHRNAARLRAIFRGARESSSFAAAPCFQEVD